MNKIYTSYFANLKKIPRDYIPVSIAVSRPKWFAGDELPIFYPPWSLVDDYKKGKIDSDRYTSQYYKILESRISKIESFIKDLKENNLIPVFLCYESPNDFCHRHLVAEFLKQYGIEVIEL